MSILGLTLVCIILAAALTTLICYMMPDIQTEFKAVFKKRKPIPKKRFFITNGLYIYNKKRQIVKIGTGK